MTSYARAVFIKLWAGPEGEIFVKESSRSGSKKARNLRVFYFLSAHGDFKINSDSFYGIIYKPTINP